MRMKIGPAMVSVFMSWALVVAAAFAADGVADKYSDGKLTVEWTKTGDDYSGTFTLGGHQFPATAHSGSGGLTGSFASGATQFAFTGKISGDSLTLTTGATTYVLTKQSAPVNPLASATPAATDAAVSTDAPAGYAVVVSTDVGKTLSVQKDGATSVQAALESTFPELARYFGDRIAIGSSYQDAKNPKSGGATFSSTLNGHPIKGIVSCKLTDAAATIVVVYALANATKAEWDMLMDPPRQGTAQSEMGASGVALHEYDFPDGTGSIGLADGWITKAPSVLHNIIVVGPDHQMLNLANDFTVQTEDSPLVQMMRQSHAVAKRTQAAWGNQGVQTPSARPAPPIVIAAYAAPADALKSVLPQLSQMSAFYHGPSYTLVKIVSVVDKPPTMPNGRAAVIDYDFQRTVQGKSVALHCQMELETAPSPYGLQGTWIWKSNSVSAPGATFDRDKTVMLAMGNSVKVNMERAKQVTAAESNALIAQNHQINAIGDASLRAQRQEMQQYHDQEAASYQASHEAQMESFAEHNQQWAAYETQKQRANADVIEQIQGTRSIYDTKTGETGSANLNDVSGVVDALNQAAIDPDRFVQLPLRDQLYAPTPVPGR